MIRTISVKRIRVLNMAQSSFESTFDQLTAGYSDREAHLMDDYYAPATVPLSYIHSIILCRELEEKSQNSQFLVTPPEHRVAARRIPGLHTIQRTAYVD